MRFTATLEDRYVIVPFDVRELWGEARPPVVGTLNGVPFKTRIAVYGGQSVLGLTNAIRAQAGVVAGRRGRDRARARPDRQAAQEVRLNAAVAESVRRSSPGVCTQAWASCSRESATAPTVLAT